MELYVILSKIKAHFTVMQDMEDEKEIVAQITSGVSFRGANLWVLIFAIFIASLGLNVNSTAVIIGAMLISPLMGPIIGMGLAIGINDFQLLRRAAKNFAIATVISILTATVYFLITPLGEAQSELLARTSPTIYDVLIATFGGAAGILALCTKGKGNVIPGVAIATALMPPLCTAGFGLASGHLLYFLGAFYLFFINTVFISLSTYLGVRLMRFHRKEFQTASAARKSRRAVMAIAILTIIPSLLMTVGIVRRSISDNNVNRFIKTELSQSGTQVISSDLDRDNQILNIVAVGREINDSTIRVAQKNLVHYSLADIKLNIIQGEKSDSAMRLGKKLSQITTSREEEKQKMVEMSAKLSETSNRLEQYTQLEQLTPDVMAEMRNLFPQVNALSLSKVAQSRRDTTATMHFVAAIISLDPKARLTPADRQRIHDWLQTRVKADSLVVY
ncbi:MAG: DUF389 domain-containing protein [Prevotella sp.]|uniref:DUF389 domain-containing protein n=1 Tax=Prevotella sp. P5-92 TaxID=2024222 RepID=UPI000B96C97F|nr:DUF389 domain-containing protein [Prevotella sp. P5-92]MDY4654061.1 DUF389 domain-containing protein [Prevotella sp.]OYP55421.1 TIGR00341 family protein [Prevotella sp. P5-92]